jgi:hypothetical protein
MYYKPTRAKQTPAIYNMLANSSRYHICRSSDVSSLKAGMYIIEVRAEGEKFHERFITE